MTMPFLRSYRAASRSSSRARRAQAIQGGAEALERKVLLSSVSVSGSSLSFAADPGEVNDVTISEAAGIITIADPTSPIVAGAGVTQVTPNEVTAPVAGLTVIFVSLGDLDDTASAASFGPAGSINRIQFFGGDGDDVMTGSDITDYFNDSPGNDSIDGGALGVDQWFVNADLDMTMDDTTLTFGGNTKTYANINAVSLGGGNSDNVIDASAVTVASGITNGINFAGRDGNDTLIGGGVRDIFRDFVGNNTFVGAGGSDAVVVNGDADMFLTDTTLTVNSSINSISGIESFDLLGGPGDNTIDASAITPGGAATRLHIRGFEGDDTLIGSYLDDTIRDQGGANTLDGGAGRDILIIGADSDQVLTNTTLTIGGAAGTHTNFEDIRLGGGASDNVLDASALDATSGVGIVYLQGLDGDDTLLGSDVQDIIGDSIGNNVIDGGGGTGDRWTASRDVDMTASDGVLIVGSDTNTFANIEDFRMTGGAGDNVLDASALTVASGVTLSVISGYGGDDVIRPSFDVPSSLTGGGIGVSGFDTLDLSHYPSQPNVTVTGPGSEDGQRGNINGAGFMSYDNINDVILPPEYDFTAASYAVAEGDTANTTMMVEVTRSITTDISSSVDVVLTSGNATSGTDFTAGPITVAFAPGDTTAAVPIEILGDTDVESDESLGLSFSGGIAGSTIPTATLVLQNDDVSNLPPEVLSVGTTARLADKGRIGEAVGLTATFLDPDAGDTHVAIVDWGDGTTSVGVVDQGTSTITADHVYDSGGVFTVSVRVTDADGESDEGAGRSIVQGVGVVDSTLFVVGSNGHDHIKLRYRGSSDEIKLSARLGIGAGHRRGDRIRATFDAADVDQIAALLDDGHDYYDGSLDGRFGNGGVAITQFVLGGDGRDWIRTGAAGDVVLAGDGRDVVFGGGGPDVLVGGDGRDYVFGGSGDDLLVGGTVSRDWETNLDFEALDSALTEWSTGDLNSTMGILGSAIDDHDCDRLFGGGGDDSFLTGVGDRTRR